jgi:GNAT superfamily N-acetyltransferase
VTKNSISSSVYPETGLEEERAFVVALGGYALELAGGVMVTNERIGVPRFNFVDGPYISADRVTAFFERALDHYFQRALRPSFRVRRPVPPHIDAALAKLEFVGHKPPLVRLSAKPANLQVAHDPNLEVSAAGPSEADRLADLWTAERERDELRRSLEVVVNHPNPGERLVPIFARRAGQFIGGAILYERGARASIQLTSTRPDARGQGIATELVRTAVEQAAADQVVQVVLLSEEPHLSARLAPLGFRIDGEFTEYVLPPDAELSLPSPGPAGPPRWRPPRAGVR